MLATEVVHAYMSNKWKFSMFHRTGKKLLTLRQTLSTIKRKINAHLSYHLLICCQFKSFASVTFKHQLNARVTTNIRCLFLSLLSITEDYTIYSFTLS